MNATSYPHQTEHMLRQADIEADAERERKLKRELADLRDVVHCLKATILSQQAEVLLAQAQVKQAQEEAAYAMNERDRAQRGRETP